MRIDSDHDGASDFERKLATCASANSLRMEAAIATTLRKLRWLPEQSAYYLDPATAKPREIDVAARQFWRRSTSAGERDAVISLIVECKSIKGWNLLFYPARPLKRHDRRSEYWFGAEIEFHPDRIVAALSGAGMSVEEISHTRELLRIQLINRSADDRWFILDVPSPKERATAFRETNVESEKDEIDKSVLWRAMQATQSALNSILHSSFEASIANIKLGLLLEEYNPANKPVAAALWAFKELQRTSHFHPVVVVEAPLRVLAGATLRKVPWLRLEQRMFSAEDDRWVDVVNVEAFATYAAYISREYEKGMRAAHGRRATRRRPAKPAELKKRPS
jgi:hypothetical protein